MKGTDVRAAGNKVSFKAWPDALLPLMLKGPLLPKPQPPLRPRVSHSHSIVALPCEHQGAPKQRWDALNTQSLWKKSQGGTVQTLPPPPALVSFLGASKDIQSKRKHSFFKLPQAFFNQQCLILPAYWYLSLLWCFLFPLISVLEKKRANLKNTRDD